MVAALLDFKFTRDEILRVLLDSFTPEQELEFHYTYDSEKDMTTLNIRIEGDWSPVDDG